MNPRLKASPVWTQIFCAALTGVLAGRDEEAAVQNADDPYGEAAYDAVIFASRVADEAFERVDGLGSE